MEYGSITWDLPYAMQYVPNTRIEANVSVKNLDIVPHSFSLVIVLTRNIEGVVYTIHEDQLLISSEEWFSLQAKEAISMPVTLVPATIPATLSLCLKEFKTQEYIDGQSVNLSQGMSMDDLGSVMVMSLLTGMMGMFRV